MNVVRSRRRNASGRQNLVGPASVAIETKQFTSRPEAIRLAEQRPEQTDEMMAMSRFVPLSRPAFIHCPPLATRHSGAQPA